MTRPKKDYFECKSFLNKPLHLVQMDFHPNNRACRPYPRQLQRTGLSKDNGYEKTHYSRFFRNLSYEQSLLKFFIFHRFWLFVKIIIEIITVLNSWFDKIISFDNTYEEIPMFLEFINTCGR